MRRIITAQCLVFSATPDRVIRTIETLGASRESKYGLVWLYPTETGPQLLFRISVAQWADGDRLNLGSTIVHEIIADLTAEDWRRWLEAVATALRVSLEEAERLITQKSSVIVDCDVFEEQGANVLRDYVLSLFAETDGVVWSGRQSWTSQLLRENPSKLQFPT